MENQHGPEHLIELAVSGAFMVRDASGRPIEGLPRRGQALLAYLASRPDMRAERAGLADLLWSDRGVDQSRASLRQLVSELRRKLPADVLRADRHCISLAAERVKAVGGEGVFLDGFDLASEGFEDWLRDMRQSSSNTPAPAASTDRIFSRPAVAVFAFEALGDQAEDKMIAEGLADDLRTTLCYWRWFPVIGPDALGWKTARETELLAASRDAGAAYAVSGSIARIGKTVRISATLTDVETGQSLWSQRFDGNLEDIFAFQETASQNIVAEVEPQLAQAEATRIRRTRPETVAPWQLLAMADEIDRRSPAAYGTPEDNAAQKELMLDALAKAPDFAPARSRLARIAFRAGLLSWVEDRDAALAEAVQHADAALAIDPEAWEAHALKGLATIFGNRDYTAGLYHGRQSVRLNPSAALARHALACALEWVGQPEEALDHMEVIFRLQSNYPGRAAILGQIASCALFTGDEDKAVSAARELVAIAPDYARGLQRSVSIFGYFGLKQEAKSALVRLREIDPNFSEAYARETYPYARTEDAERMLEGLSRAGAFASVKTA